MALPRYTPVSSEWESRETEFDKLGGELSVCLSSKGKLGVEQAGS